MALFFEGESPPYEPRRHSKTGKTFAFPNYNEFARRGGADAIMLRDRDASDLRDDDDVDGDERVGIELQWPNRKNLAKLLKTKNFKGGDDYYSNAASSFSSITVNYRIPRRRNRGRHGIESDLPGTGELVSVMLIQNQYVYHTSIISIYNRPNRPNTGRIVLDFLTEAGGRATAPQTFLRSVRQTNPRLVDNNNKTFSSAIF